MKSAFFMITHYSKVLLLTTVFANSLCSFSVGTSLGDVTNLVSDETTIPSWSGFSADFDPHWAGETMRLNWSRGGGGGIIITHVPFSPWEYIPPKPTELLGSFRSVSSESRAYVSVGGKSATADSSYDYDSYASEADAGRWNSTLARYARVIDLDDYVLGKATSLASIESEVTDSNYNFTGRIQTGGVFDPVVNGYSRLSSSADVDFEATYQVNKNSQFILNGSIAGSAGLDAQFTIVDRTSGALFYEQSLTGLESDNGIKHFSLRGEVTPGVYDFNLVTNSRNEMSRGEIMEQGEIGELNLDFNWIPWGTGAGDFDINGFVDHGDLTQWHEMYGQHDDGDIDLDGDVDQYDYEAWYFSADVKDMNGNGWVGEYDDFSAWLATERPGDADGDRDSDGIDFLIWQRDYTSQAASTAQSQSVPEPPTSIFILLASAFLWHRKAKCAWLSSER